MEEVPVYADGSITPSFMTTPQSSQTSATEFFGRICLVIPSQDYGLIERFVNGLLTAKGNPDTTYSEYLAILRAGEVCTQLGLAHRVIYSDALEAVKRANSPDVKWLPAGEFHPASAFLHRVLSRASYVRRSGRKVTRRMPLTQIQQEAFDLLQVEKKEFKLSSSLIWAKIQSDLARGLDEESGSSAEAQ